MSSNPKRQFTIRDMAIVIAMIACSFAWIRAIYPGFDPLVYLRSNPGIRRPVPAYRYCGTEDRIGEPVTATRDHLVPLLVPFTLGGLVIRLQRPRPGRGRLWRQPGHVALAAASAAIAWLLVPILLTPSIANSRDDLLMRCWSASSHVLPAKIANVGYTVAGAWLLLAISRGWRAETSWIDRYGRLVGLSWVVLVLLDPLFEYLR